MTTITLEQLIELEACREGLGGFRRYCGESITWEGGFTLEDQIALIRGPLRPHYQWVVECGLLPMWSMRHVDLSGADLCDAGLRLADLKGADLSGADLRWADLQGANLAFANLAGADLGYTDLTGANLNSADLTGANLVDASLRRADLFHADLADANLEDADLREADLRWTIISEHQKKQAFMG